MSETHTPRLDGLLKTAGEPTRLRILNLLRRGRICVCDIQAVLALPQPTVSRHLAALRHAGLVTDTREGPRVMYSLAATSSDLLQCFYRFLDETCAGEPQLQKDLKTLEETAGLAVCEPAPPGHDTLRQSNTRGTAGQ